MMTDEILEKVFSNYFSIDGEKKYFETDKQFMKFLCFLKDESDIENLEKLIKKFDKQKSKYFTEKMLNGDISDDIPEIEKEFINIKIPFVSSFEKLMLLDAIIGKESLKIFNMSIPDIVTILNAILIRVVSYSSTCNDKDKSKIYFEIFGAEPSPFFTSDQIFNIVPFIDENIIKSFLNIFSVNYSEIKDIHDTQKILKINDKYILYFLPEIFDNFFQFWKKRF